MEEHQQYDNTEASTHFTAVFPLIRGTKKPKIKKWQLTLPNSQQYDHFGVNLQADELIIDIDPRNYPIDPIFEKPINSFAKLTDKWTIPGTRMIKTPSGGYHLYFLKDPDIKVRVKQSEYPGIDFLSSGHFVVGQNCTTQAGIYQLVNDIEPATIPLKFLNSLQEAWDTGNELRIDDTDFDDSPDNINAYRAWLAVKAEPGIQGRNGQLATVKAAYVGRDHGLSLYQVQECMWEAYNPRCEPRWLEDELDAKVEGAYTTAKGEFGSKSILYVIKKDEELGLLPPAAPQLSAAGKEVIDYRNHHLRMNYVMDDANKKEVPNNITNARLKLEASTDFGELFYYDAFAQKVMYEREPWWRKGTGSELGDDDLVHIWDWMMGKQNYKCGIETLRAAITVLAQKNRKHPLQDYLNSLKWDGLNRLDTYLIDTCGAPDDRWSRIAGRKWLIGAVNRAYEPGCQMDYVLILQGEQGIRKSSWVKTLAGPWAASTNLNPDNDEIHTKLLGRWILELPEINQSLSKKDVNAIKSLITETHSLFRKKYGHLAANIPRTSAFIGTINNIKELGYLKDPTGDRRYWPISVEKCDTDLLAKMRDQLFAEAVVAYKAGERCLLDEEQNTQAKLAQDEVRELDAWVNILESYLRGIDQLTTQEAYSWLEMKPYQIGDYHHRRVCNSLRALNYRFHRGNKKWIKMHFDVGGS